MWRKRIIYLAAGVLCLAVLLVSLVEIHAAQDAPAASYAIPWWSVDSGGGVSQGGPFTLSGTIGQPEPGELAGGSYLLKGGFWSGVISYNNYLPLLFR